MVQQHRAAAVDLAVVDPADRLHFPAAHPVVTGTVPGWVHQSAGTVTVPSKRLTANWKDIQISSVYIMEQTLQGFVF